MWIEIWNLNLSLKYNILNSYKIFYFEFGFFILKSLFEKISLYLFIYLKFFMLPSKLLF